MSEHEQPWVHCGSCPVCESGLRRLRCEELTDGYQELFALCDECEAIWMVPDPEAKLQFPDPENPTSPWSGQPLYGSHSRWATPQDIVGTVWESVAQIEGVAQVEANGQEWEVLSSAMGPSESSIRQGTLPDRSMWRLTQTEWRQRLVLGWSKEIVERFRGYHQPLNSGGEERLRVELGMGLEAIEGQRILEIGPGLGRFSGLWRAANKVEWELLEPAPAFVRELRELPEFSSRRIVEGFCDSFQDRGHFSPSRFDGVVCANVVNELYDPLSAWQNIRHWLKPGGWLCIVEGLLERSAWEDWGSHAIDHLPLACNQSLALLPYLLECSGFEIEVVRRLPEMDAILGGRHPRYMVKARRG